MYAGAAGFPLVVLVFLLLTSLEGKGSPLHDPSFSWGTYISYSAIVVLPVTALWLWMAVMNGRGRSWARALSTVFFAFYSLSLIPSAWFLLLVVAWGPGDGNPSPHAASQAVRTALIGAVVLAAPILLGWAISLATIVLLWRRESSDYYAAVGALHRHPGAADRTPRVAGSGS